MIRFARARSSAGSKCCKRRVRARDISGALGALGLPGSLAGNLLSVGRESDFIVRERTDVLGNGVIRTGTLRCR